MHRAAFRRVVTLALATTMGALAVPGGAANDTVLRRVSGQVGYTQSFTSPYIAVTGNQTLDASSFAITGVKSQGLIELPDSSVIGLGASSRVQVSAIESAAAGGGTQITVPANGGGATIRFDVKHPTGAQSNYHFITPTSNVAVRGTSGLLSSGANGDTITCLQCAPNDMIVTVGARTYPLITGQTLTVSLAGVVATIATTAVVLQSFASAGLATSASATVPVVGAATAAGVSGAAAAAAGAVVVGGAAAAASSTSKSPSTAQPSPVPTATGIGTIQGHRR